MIICEIGMNHLGSGDYADKYIDSLVVSGADAITFQIRENSYYERKERGHLSLPMDYYLRVMKKIKEKKLKFGVSISEITKVKDFNLEEVNFFKVLSKDISDFHLLDEFIATGKPLFVSTGTSDLETIEKTVNYLKDKGVTPSYSHFFNLRDRTSEPQGNKCFERKVLFTCCIRQSLKEP